MRRARLKRLIAFLALFVGFGAAEGGEAYYVLMFGAQRMPRNPNHAHTFATFVRATCPGPDCPGTILEAHTISWLPADLTIHTQWPIPECGHNFGLHETMDFCLGQRERVSLWGPFEIDADLYFQAIEQKAKLESGRVLYRAIDAGRPNDRVCNCIHACANVVKGPRLRVLTPGWGDTASYFVLLRYRPYILDPDTDHYWVSSALGLDQYPIAYRDNPPGGGPVLPLTGVRLGSFRARTTFGPPSSAGCD